MVSKRVTALMAVLLILILGYVFRPLWEAQLFGSQIVVGEPPLPGMNSISSLVVHQNSKGGWTADFDYFYTGAPFAWIYVNPISKSVSNEPQDVQREWEVGTFVSMKRGQHHVSVEIQRPRIQEAFTTNQIVAVMVGSSPQPGQLPNKPYNTRPLLYNPESRDTWQLARAIVIRKNDAHHWSPPGTSHYFLSLR